MKSPNQSKSIDFSEAIGRLMSKAKSSRQRVVFLSSLLATSILAIVAFLLWTLSSQSARVLVAVEDRGSYIEGSISRQVSDLMDEILGPRARGTSDFEAPDALRLAELGTQLDDAIGRYERIRKLNDASSGNEPTSSSLVPVLTTGIFSFGVVGIIILIINICISFIRYHSQLAELYEAQADALRASHGSAELAYQFADHFSPIVVPMGNVPASIYEKALDVVKEAAGRHKP